MRALLPACILCAVLCGCGCSREPDLTKEQKAALQAMGEMLTPDPDRKRFNTVVNSLETRRKRYVEAAEAFERGSQERHDADSKARAFDYAATNLIGDYYRRLETDGRKKAADWIVAESKKSDDQIVEAWDFD